MDKTKFTDRPGDSEGFVERTLVDLRPMFYDGTTVHMPTREHPTEFDYQVQAKKALAEHFLNGPVQTFDGEAGTYSDVKCNTCSPWALLDQDHLDRIHQIWVNSAERYRQQLADWYHEAQTEAKL